ncbi:MAG: exopolysaccharide Pel transporter PelG [Leptospirillia bacterium]
MAGIGFVLRKLVAREDLSSLAGAFVLSALVAAGPWLLTTVGLLIVSYSSLGSFTRVRDYLLFRSLVTFAFFASLVMVSIIQLAATRFVADRFFERQFSDIRSIYITSVALALLFGVPMAGLLVLPLHLGLPESLGYYGLLVVLILLWVTTSLVSTLHDYKSVGAAFLLGVGISVAGTLYGARHGGTAGALLGYLFGEGVIVALLGARIFVEFPGEIRWNRSFVAFLRRRVPLMVLGLVMTLGIWVDKILFWYGPGSEQIVGYIRVNRLYDIAMFFSLLTVIPTLALFVFYFETGFYEHYREVFNLLGGRRPLDEVLEAKARMVAFLKRGLGYILKIQGAVTFLVVLNGHGILSLFHADLLALPIFRLGALGGLCQVTLTLEFTLLLYFNQQKMVSALAWVLLLSNAGLTLLLWNVSPRLEGMGYLTACLVSALYGYYLVDRGVYDFEFTVFMKPSEERIQEEFRKEGEDLVIPPSPSQKERGRAAMAGLLVLGILSGLFPSLSHAAERTEGRGVSSGPIHRTCYVLYYGLRKETNDANNFRAYWEFPLNYLGFDAVYRKMTRGFPDPASLTGYRAVFLQIDRNPLPDSLAFWRFVSGLLDKKIPFAILEDFPERRKGDPNYEAAGLLRDRVLLRMGLKREGVWDTNPFDLDYGHRDSRMEGFEYPLPLTPATFRPLVSLSPENSIFLGVKSNEARNDGLESPYGMLAPWGGMVFDPFMIRWSSLDADHTLWFVNPFRFLERLLRCRNLPRMDLTTLNGNRIFYSQVDGDAFETLSHYKRRRMSAEVLYREIFRPTPLPFTVSVITSQIDPAVQGSRARVYWARKIFSLPNVEAGSHTFSHPFYWVPTKKQKDEGPIHIEIPHYRLNLETEIRGSIDYINRHLLPPGKTVRLLQWSGDTRPGPEALRELEGTGVDNLNGSDTRFDNNAPSYTFVFPYFRRVGPYIQYFNSDVNDYILTNDWKGPYYGYLNVTKTFLRTDRPRRVDPIDVYFHFYAGQRESSLNALRQVLAWVQRQQIAPLFSSQFVAVEKGYIAARFDLLKNGQKTLYRVSKYGADTTVRFDHASALYPDLSCSRGVIGYRHREGSLYLYLVPGGKSARLCLSGAPPKGVFLSRATGYVSPVGVLSPREVAFVYNGWVPADRVVWRGLLPSTDYTLVEKGGRDQRILRTDDTGRLVLTRLASGTLYRVMAK